MTEEDDDSGRLLEHDHEISEEDFNLMVEYLQANVYPFQKDIDAGAIYFECPPIPDRMIICDVKLNNNNFDSNIAGNKGGALRWVNYPFNMTSEDGADTNTYSDNKADYGQIQGSYPL